MTKRTENHLLKIEKSTDFEETSLRNLLCAIILQAVKDYSTASANMYELLSKTTASDEQMQAVVSEIREIEDFFLSDWFKKLYSVDGSIYINNLRTGEYRVYTGNIIHISPNFCTV